MKRRIAVWLLLLALLPCLALAETKTRWTDVPETIRPGKAVRMTFSCPVETSATVTLVDASGSVAATLWDAEPTCVGDNYVYWDGLTAGQDVPEGTYTLHIALSGKEVETSVVIGPEAPRLEVLDYEDAVASFAMTVETSMAGELQLCAVLESGETEVLRQACEAGETTVSWDGTVNGTALPAGDYELVARLYDATGFSSSPASVSVTVEAPYTPPLATDLDYHLPSGTPCDHDACYWKLNMGEMDERAIWEVLTTSVYVLSGDQRQQAKVYEQPDKASRAIAEVTQESQAVHILGQEGDWTLIEGYSSSVEGSSVANYANLFTGYVPTSTLKEKKVSQKYGIVIDKLQQRLYVFKDGKLFSTLLCSTGYARSDTPFNETPAGEFLMVSRTGGFWSGSLYCDMALRINDGILMHEVPCLIAEDGVTRDYTRCEQYLGEKASHGCIRIQRKSTPEGVSMKWLWENLEINTKVLIWDDAGRELVAADEAVTLYYNPNKGQNYHSSATCMGVKTDYWPLTAFTYGELDDEPYASLTPCPYCAPQLRQAGIDKLNEQAAAR